MMLNEIKKSLLSELLSMFYDCYCQEVEKNFLVMRNLTAYVTHAFGVDIFVSNAKKHPNCHN